MSSIIPPFSNNMCAKRELMILGIGSPFGADPVGWQAVELLRGESTLHGVQFACLDRPGASLLGPLQGARAAILIDALVCDSPPGTLHRIDPEALALGDRYSNHGFGVADALALGRVLGTLPPLAIIGISASGAEMPILDPSRLIAMVLPIAREMETLAN